jgi:uncharacterized damage-inducible protein DinB
MSAHSHYQRFALYNQWANARIYDAVFQLPAEEYKRDRGMFFKSIHGTLNHLLVTDYMWTHRITGEGLMPSRLDEILFDHFSFLRPAREAQDKLIIDMIDGFSEQDFGREFSYMTVSYGERKDILAVMLAHLFNHQTHHRGQVHNCLSQCGLKAPSLDLIFFLREQEKAA